MEKRRDLEHAAEEIEQLFADLWQVFPFSGVRRGFRPHVDCLRTEDPPALTVLVELAGVAPEDVQIVCTGRTLVVAGRRCTPKLRGATYQQMEIDYGTFQRQINLPEEVDGDRGEASYERGVLTIVLPLAPKAPPKGSVQITVTRS